MFGNAVEDLRQGLVDGIQRHVAFNAGMDVDVDLRIARQREQDFARRQIGDDDAVGLHFRCRFWRRQDNGMADGLRDGAAGLRGRSGGLLDVLVGWFDRSCAAGNERDAGNTK